MRAFAKLAAPAAAAATTTASLLLLLLFSATIPAIRAIYPDDHWMYSKKLTQSNFKDTIQAEIDSGRTMFVRWIASPG